MDWKKFQLPESLKDKVFSAEAFFEKKASRTAPGPRLLLETLSGAERVVRDGVAFIRRRVEIPLKTGRSDEGYVLPGDAGAPLPDGESLRLLSGDEWWEPPDAPRVLFFDLETTGLAGGAGTYPFLCGLGRFEKNAFVVEQYFMEDYPSEPLMLEALSERFHHADCLVSFNGKTFDLPLLRTRFIYNRMRINLDTPHIDLLHPSRRLWKRALSDCRLETIEKEFFGLRRDRDVESALIPMIYFQFVRGRRLDWILPVFHHNVQDIASMGGMIRLFSGLLKKPVHRLLTTAEEYAGLARFFIKLGMPERALFCRRYACRKATGDAARDSHLYQTSLLYKKLGRWRRAESAWLKIAGRPGPLRLAASVELAKYYEHKVKDFHEAREVILRAVSLSDMEKEIRGYMEGLELNEDPLTPEIEKRLSRLERKIKRAEKRRQRRSGEE